MPMADKGKLTHLDSRGQARMVDVGGKPLTQRTAIAEGQITMSAQAFQLLAAGGGDKGDVLAAARIAGISAAKKTAELIPLCHIIALDSVKVTFKLNKKNRTVLCSATATATAKTGVEMEALAAVQIALLTVYDMLKAADKAMEISGIRLMKKTGGKSGIYSRQ